MQHSKVLDTKFLAQLPHNTYSPSYLRAISTIAESPTTPTIAPVMCLRQPVTWKASMLVRRLDVYGHADAMESELSIAAAQPALKPGTAIIEPITCKRQQVLAGSSGYSCRRHSHGQWQCHTAALHAASASWCQQPPLSLNTEDIIIQFRYSDQWHAVLP
jgi:hypothetical protein